MKPFWTIICTLGFLAVVSFGFSLSGNYDISAKSPHWALTTYFLRMVRDHSISRYSATLKLPPLGKPTLALKGVLHFNETCWQCHGAPGRNPEEFAMGLYPPPPPLEIAESNLNPKEIFWIIDNGIKFTGMPSFGLTHSKDQILAMVAFIEKLPAFNAQGYKKFVDDAESQFGNKEHPHGETPPAGKSGAGN